MTENSYDLFNKIVRVQGGAKSQKADEFQYNIPCPSHKDTNPSLTIAYKAGKVLLKCHSGCTQESVIGALKAQGLWYEKEVTHKKPTTRKKQFETLIPAPKSLPESIRYGRDDRQPTKIWKYYTRNGKLAFAVVRWDRDDGKIVRPYSYVRFDDGTEGWHFGMRPGKLKKPLFNLRELIERPDAPVLIVEGEKAADAAKAQFPQHVVVTWQGGGVSGLTKTDLLPLRDKDITVWPDNDDAGIKTANKFGEMLSKTGTKIAPKVMFEEPLSHIKPKWDLADGLASDTGLGLEDAVEMDIELQPKDGGLRSEISERLSQKFKTLYIGKTFNFVDVTVKIAGSDQAIPFYVLGRVQDLKIYHPDTFIDLGTESLKPVSEVDAWLEDTGRKEEMLSGVFYTPETEDVIVEHGGVKKLNINCGIKNKAVKGTELHKPFIKHIRKSMGEDGEWFLDWLADIFQNPGRKPGTCTVLVGKPGTGKTLIGNIICSVIGDRHAYMGAFHTTFGKGTDFNEHMSAKLFVQLDEMELGLQKKTIEAAIKVATTDVTIRINPKGFPAWTETSFHRYLFTTNSRTTVEVGVDDRRLAIFDVNHYHVDEDHWRSLWNMMRDERTLGAIRGYFEQRIIRLDVSKPPVTEARQEMMHDDDSLLVYIEECLHATTSPDGWLFLEHKDYPSSDTYESFDWITRNSLVSRSSVYDSYRTWLRDTGRPYDHRPTPVVGKIMAGVFPKSDPVKKVSFRWPDSGLSKQDRAFMVPRRWRAREDFEAYLERNIRWDDMDDMTKPDANVVEMDFGGDMPE